ncbi:hypothetical protein ATANTOWER_025646 [Ataeniobius toweri]|uniref:Uncharacterized protein n=1 Tax=Ataeniobius toweri TaxID=208326 RepID=A0ABU7CKN4_9TELE|nr:hypothetical protein [Ataeniobius toweri]
MVEFLELHSALVTLADQMEENNLSYEAIFSCLADIFQMIGMIIALQNVSIDDAIVDPLRTIEHRVRMENAEHSTKGFNAVWHNHRGYCCYVFYVAQHSSLRSSEPTVTPADVSSLVKLSFTHTRCITVTDQTRRLPRQQLRK